MYLTWRILLIYSRCYRKEHKEEVEYSDVPTIDRLWLILLVERNLAQRLATTIVASNTVFCLSIDKKYIVSLICISPSTSLKKSIFYLPGPRGIRMETLLWWWWSWIATFSNKGIITKTLLLVYVHLEKCLRPTLFIVMCPGTQGQWCCSSSRPHWCLVCWASELQFSVLNPGWC